MAHVFPLLGRSRGFTLIEILVVIAIIGILVSAITINFSSSRENTRNEVLRSEMKEVQLALELYKAQYGEYPAALTGVSGCTGGSTNYRWARDLPTGSCSGREYIQGLVPQFLPQLPRAADSQNSDCIFNYYVSPNQDWYKLTAAECISGADSAAEGIQPDDELARCMSSCSDSTYPACNESSEVFYQSLAVYSNGGQCW